MKQFLSLFTVLLIISGCSVNSFDLSKEPSGVWRNDAEKIDYHFGPNDILKVVGEKGDIHNLGCTFAVDKIFPESRTIEVYFGCPQADAPAYGEQHKFIYSEDGKSFIDTSYFQGMVLKRYDGRFMRITP